MPLSLGAVKMSSQNGERVHEIVAMYQAKLNFLIVLGPWELTQSKKNVNTKWALVKVCSGSPAIQISGKIP